MKKYHMIGIGGIGMSALAKLLLEQKQLVTGSDLKSTPITSSLESIGAKISTSQEGVGLQEDSIVVYSSSIRENNIEWKLAKKLNCPLLHRSALLQNIASLKRELVVTGCHGKTTTTSLLTTVLIQARLDPSYAIGGILQSEQTNAKHGRGDYFILEADESDGTFVNYTPYGAIITNIDYDHMDHWKTKENLVQGYQEFIKTVKDPEKLFVCGDDPLLQKVEAITYGFKEHNELIAKNISQKGEFLHFDIHYQGKIYPDIELKGIGKHLVLNALGVFGLSLKLGIEEKALRKAFKTFGGVKRRVEKRLEKDNVLYLDDYAHHPKEIETTIDGVKSAYPDKRLIALFQPHRFTRTRDCLNEFPKAFLKADLLILTDIYGAGETPIPGITVEALLEKMTIPTHFIKREDLAMSLPPLLKENDLLLSMGAGDITNLTNELKKTSLGLLFGGRSAEHPISLRSCRGVFEALDKNAYDTHLFAILPEGHWVQGEEAYDYLYGKACPTPKERLSAEVLQELLKLDLIFPVLHGPYGEDGIVQGFFDTLGIAYVGCPHTACAAAMDKVIAKQIFIANNFATAAFIYFSKYEWGKKSDQLIANIEQTLSYPLFVKPANLGSSIGVSRAATREELFKSIALALQFGEKIIVENEIRGREIEFAVFGNDEITVFHPGEVLKGDRSFYCYEGKYSQDPSKAIETTTRAEIPASIINQLIPQIKEAYRAFDCKVFARFDCFLDSENRLWFSELNPIPGFTSASLVPKIAENAGISFTKLIDWLISLSKEKINF